MCTHQSLNTNLSGCLCHTETLLFLTVPIKMFQKVLKVQIWLSRLGQWLKIGKFANIYIYIHIYVPCIMLWLWKDWLAFVAKHKWWLEELFLALGHWLHFSAHEIAVWFNYCLCEFSTKSDRKGKTIGVCFKGTLEMETCSTRGAVCWAFKIQLMSPLILCLTASYHIYCNLSQVIEHCLQSRRHLKPLEWSGIFL